MLSRLIHHKIIKKSIQCIGYIWLLLGISILLFVLLEVVCYFILVIKDGIYTSTSRVFDSNIEAYPYNKVPWYDDYRKEFDICTVKWEPYLYWRRKPYKGNYINISKSGLRVVPNQEVNSNNRDRALRLFMFGGSTMWGTGARDSFTIPALVAKELRNRGIRAEVINFGETGYVSTQEVIALLLQLQRRNIPDLVVFYDGANDTYSTYQQRIAGLPQNEYNRIKEFNITNRPLDMTMTAIREGASSLAITHIMNGVFRRIGIKDINQKKVSNDEARLIAKETLNIYSNNLDLIKSLAESYKFKCLFYWQPTIFGKNKLSDYEKVEYTKQQQLENIFSEIYIILTNKESSVSSEKSFHDLSDIFHNLEEPVYIDWIHLSEKGNIFIAQEMSKEIKSLASGLQIPSNR